MARCPAAAEPAARPPPCPLSTFTCPRLDEGLGADRLLGLRRVVKRVAAPRTWVALSRHAHTNCTNSYAYSSSHPSAALIRSHLELDRHVTASAQTLDNLATAVHMQQLQEQQQLQTHCNHRAGWQTGFAGEFAERWLFTLDWLGCAPLARSSCEFNRRSCCPGTALLCCVVFMLAMPVGGHGRLANAARLTRRTLRECRAGSRRGRVWGACTWCPLLPRADEQAHASYPKRHSSPQPHSAWRARG